MRGRAGDRRTAAPAAPTHCRARAGGWRHRSRRRCGPAPWRYPRTPASAAQATVGWRLRGDSWRVFVQSATRRNLCAAEHLTMPILLLLLVALVSGLLIALAFDR